MIAAELLARRRSGMMCVMILALGLAHTARPKPFNADFYITAATVIPVLFLAIAVQGTGTAYDALLAQPRNIVRWGRRRAARNPAGCWSAIVVIVGVAAGIGGALALAAVIVALGVAGEIRAMLSLYDQGPAGRPDSLVLEAVMVLTVVAGTPPFVQFMARGFHPRYDDEEAANPAAAAKPEEDAGTAAGAADGPDPAG